MDTIRPVTLVHAKDHPVIDRPLSWRLHDVEMRLESDGSDRVRVLLTLVRERERRRCRFDGVADFALTGGVAGTSVRILDVTHLQWCGIALRVESTCGRLGFWAGSVSDGAGRSKR